MLLPIIICILLTQTQTRDVTLRVLSDAFWQVAVFVAMTLTIYHLFADKISHLYTNNKGEVKPFREVVTASFMGVLPGCGGAIVVITQYVSGQMSFGAFSAINKIAPKVVFDINNITSQSYEHLEQGDTDLIVTSGLKGKRKFIQTAKLYE